MKNLRLLVVATVVLFGALSGAQAGIVEEGTKSFKLVCDDIYREIGSPTMTEEIAEKMDRLIFQRDMDKKPALSTKVNTSWGAYKNTLTAMISADVDGRLERARVIWRPGRELEKIDPDAVLEW